MYSLINKIPYYIMFLPEHGAAKEQTPEDLFLRTANSDLAMAYDQIQKDPEAYKAACETVKQVIKDSEEAAREIFRTKKITDKDANLLSTLSRNLKARAIKDARKDRDRGAISQEIFLAMKDEPPYDYASIIKNAK